MSWSERVKTALDNEGNERIIQIEQALKSFGIHKPEHTLVTVAEAYIYLRTAILFVITNEEFQKELTTTLYTKVAKFYVSKGCLATTKIVEAGITSMIAYAWCISGENAQAWKMYFGFSPEEIEVRPTNFEFILTIATALRSIE